MTDQTQRWILGLNILAHAATGQGLQPRHLVAASDALASLAREMHRVCRGTVGPHMRLEWPQ